MPIVAETATAPLPLTHLNEEEKMFQSMVRKFARERIGPHVREMDEAGVFRKDLLQEMFELGLMGIEIPGRIRRTGRQLLSGGAGDRSAGGGGSRRRP